MIKKDIFIIIILTFVFSFVLFFLRVFLLEDFTDNKTEESYIDRSLFLEIIPNNISTKNVEKNSEKISINEDLPQDLDTDLNTIELLSGKVIENNKDLSLNNQTLKIDDKDNLKNNANFYYFPDQLRKEVALKILSIKRFLSSSFFYKTISDFSVELHKDLYDVRGKMKDGRVKLFGVKKMDDNEMMSVFVHEFGHYLDIYFMTRSVFSDEDPSFYFYDISWESTKIIKMGMLQKDLVSGYSSTNKYEDLAESFTYYILHNSSFRKKAEKSEILKKKYDFFKTYLFKNNEFIGSDFSKNDDIKDYYRDITKIEINSKNFLQYLKKSI